VNAGFDRAFGAPYNLGDFRQGEILERIQDQDFAVLESELIQGLMESGGSIHLQCRRRSALGSKWQSERAVGELPLPFLPSTFDLGLPTRHPSGGTTGGG
jgi:hypothetical protein